MKWIGRIIDLVFDRPIDALVRHFENRLFELAMASCFLAGAIVLTFSPSSVKAGGLSYLSGINVTALTAIFYLTGLSRIIALALNGHWKYGAYVRACGAVVGAFMWGGVILPSLVVFGMATGNLPFSVGTYAVLAFFEIVSMYRALAGAKRGSGERGRRPAQVGYRGDLGMEAGPGALYRGGGGDRAVYRPAVAQGPARSG